MKKIYTILIAVLLSACSSDDTTTIKVDSTSYSLNMFVQVYEFTPNDAPHLHCIVVRAKGLGITCFKKEVL
jgi:hypothetical protein